ncbi:acyl-CoA dehydrogenase family protein [Rhizobium skierniewicense]|uniref:acyl-CoA dehydrogenase family protein n=1 Tax=Rhizobium skierniewicense TaxID=984260 RepID=UPI001FAC58D8|nr:acyl-CoA dehydrogenase family protein [Rhizobium skierniewicense]MCI9866883.1 acyl-CoA dehydrogenase family protein [Rhizobium skierniewicense]
MMVPISDRLRPVPLALTREGDVVAALDRLEALATSGNLDHSSVLPASGLLAMSIPASFGGADISNLIVAEAVSRIATLSTNVAERLLGHLVALEMIRTSGSTEQRKAIYARVVLGDVFELSSRREGVAPPRLVRSGLAFALEHGGSVLANSAVDWQIIGASGAGSEPVVAILDHKHVSARNDASSDLTVHPDYVLSRGENADCLARLMTAFLKAAYTRGHVNAQKRTNPPEPAMAVEVELLDGMIQKAASLIDVIQVDDPPIDLEQIDRFCRALDTARLRGAGDHSPAIRS